MPYFNEEEVNRQNTLKTVKAPIAIHKTAGDGSCFFRALAYSLTGNHRYLLSQTDEVTDYLRDLRSKIVNKVVSKWDKYREFVFIVHKKRDKNEYHEYMSNPTTYVDATEVVAASEIHPGISIYRPRRRHYLATNQTPRKMPQLYHIHYNGRNHYEGATLN